MSTQTITLNLPEDIYHRLQGMAQVTHQPLEEVAFQTIRGNLPPAVDDLLPELRSELAALHDLSDEDLWRITREPLPPAQWRRHQSLLRQNAAGRLTDAKREELAHLRAATDRFVIRRSYALALLKWRGHTLPTPDPVKPNAPTPKNPRRRSPQSR